MTVGMFREDTLYPPTDQRPGDFASVIQSTKLKLGALAPWGKIHNRNISSQVTNTATKFQEIALNTTASQGVAAYHKMKICTERYNWVETKG